LPTPGMSMNTPAIGYFSWVKCAHKYKTLIVFIGDQNVKSAKT